MALSARPAQHQLLFPQLFVGRRGRAAQPFQAGSIAGRRAGGRAVGTLPFLVTEGAQPSFSSQLDGNVLYSIMKKLKPPLASAVVAAVAVSAPQ